MTGPLVIDWDAVLRLYAEALADSPATVRLLVGMGVLEYVEPKTAEPSA